MENIEEMTESQEVETTEAETQETQSEPKSLESYLEEHTQSEESEETKDEKESKDSKEAPSHEDLEKQLGELEVESDDKEFLGTLNEKLGKEFESVEAIKEALEKTPDESEVREKIEKEFQAKNETKMKEYNEQVEAFNKEREQFQDAINEHSVIVEVLEELKSSDPEVFEELLEAYNRKASFYTAAQNNPAYQKLNQKTQALEEQLKQLTGKETQKETREIVDGWESEYKDVQKEFGAKLRALKVAPNWKEVQRVWESDGTGKMSVKEAFYATHGEKLAKALEAHNKAAKTKSESDKRIGKRYDQGQTQEKLDSKTEYLLKLAEKHAN